ncbi:MAG: outer membrane protein [Acidobacteriota bacterium]|jgi:HAE1 family hydrophobic/amphiphilic exporter-1|nr:outer membrane protein [Acidobacteriota bacterium]
MLTKNVHRSLKALALALLIFSAGVGAQAQTPQPTPPSSPAQQDATRPPGTERNQPVPEQVRPVTQDPTAPPGSQRPAPQAPPGTSGTPQTGTPQAPVATPLPTATDSLPPSPDGTTPASTQTPSTSETQSTPDLIEEPREPVFPTSQPKPLPAPPVLTRLGVLSDNLLPLSLNEAIRRALENNNDIEVARNDVRLAETTLRSFQGIYDPVLNINPELNNLVQSQQSTLGGGTDQSGTLTTTDFRLDNSISKFFSVGGGSYQFFFNNNRRTTNSRFNQLNPVYSSSFGVTFTQPLWRDRSIDNNRRQIRIQRKRLEQSDADFRRRTIDVITQVQRAYWDLVFALRDQQNQIANLNLTRENLRRVEAQISAGSVAPLERAEVQTELSRRESDVLIATQGVTVAENNLKQLMLRDTQAPEWSAQVTPIDAPSFDSTPVNLNDALTEARTNRPELRRLTLSRDINDIDLKYFKNQMRPRIDLQATVASTGLSGTPIVTTDPITGQVIPSTVPPNLVGGYGRTLGNLFGFDTRNLVAGVAIQIPLRNRTAEANLAGSRIQRTQLEATTRLQEQSIEVEVRNSAQSVETSRRRVLAARSARENAELQLAGEQRLYQVGRSTTFLLFQRENQLANARNLELRAETDYNKALADLQRATSTTLRANNIIVETPTVP